MLYHRWILMRYYKHNSPINIAILAVILLHGTVGQDIVFPGENMTEVLHQAKDITPQPTSSSDVSPTTTGAPEIKCDQNMILEETNGTYFCECIRGYVYYPKSDKCYGAYLRGPCDEGHHLVLGANRTIAECVVNPCKSDNEVLYQGTCYGIQLSEGPCPPERYLIISETTYEPACEKIQPVTYQFITAPMKPCAPGSRRAGRGLCRMVL